MTKKTAPLPEHEVLTMMKIVMEAGEGDTRNLEGVIAAMTAERDALIKQVTVKVADLNARIDLFTTLLNQAPKKERENGLG